MVAGSSFLEGLTCSVPLSLPVRKQDAAGLTDLSSIFCGSWVPSGHHDWFHESVGSLDL